MLSLAVIAPMSAITTGASCTPGTTINMKWDSYASEWGLYTIDGCSGVSPKLMLAAGATYTFVQTDASNWYHPVGFAYIAGGAHTTCKDAAGAEGECPEIGGTAEAAASPTTSSVLQYYVNGAAVTSDESGFGLDAYEPLFFNSQDWWGEQTFKVTLTIPAAADYTRLYYFCHIHSGMSAEIEITGSSASSPSIIDPLSLGGETEATARAIYSSILANDQAAIGTFDETCGTHSSGAYDPATNAQCENKHFLCGADSDTFSQCLSAIDCEMHYKMAVSVPSASTSKFATFARQMIAHHQNAVSMAKALQKHMTAADFPPAGTEDQDMAWAEGLIRSIINVQNSQTQQMQGWLEANAALAGSSTMCYEEFGEPAAGISTTIVIIVGVAAALVSVVLGLLIGMMMKKKPSAEVSKA